MNEEILDIFDRKIRLTAERKKHFEENHPEMQSFISKIMEVL